MGEGGEASTLVMICNLLSLTVLLLCVVMKLPQIWSAFRSGDTKGISLKSVLLEQCGYSIMLSYSFAMEYPVGNYLETAFLLLQNFALLGLIIHTRNMLSPNVFIAFLLYPWLVNLFHFEDQLSSGRTCKICCRQVLQTGSIKNIYVNFFVIVIRFIEEGDKWTLTSSRYMIVYLSIGYRLVPDFVLTSVISLGFPLGVSSKVTQILDLYSKKEPGRLSMLTWGIAAYGCYVRVFTHIVQTGDIVIIINFATSAVLNTTIVAMIYYYTQLAKSKLY